MGTGNRYHVSYTTWWTGFESILVHQILFIQALMFSDGYNMLGKNVMVATGTKYVVKVRQNPCVNHEFCRHNFAEKTYVKSRLKSLYLSKLQKIGQ